MSIWLLLACGTSEKDTSDTAVTAEPSSEASTEPSSEASTEPSSEASTEPSSEASTEPSGEPQESDFPELQVIFDEHRADANPMPMIPEDMSNTTAFATFLISYAPVITLQMEISFSGGQENITCPTIEGTFPEDGFPEEDVIVTGNGCTNDSGTTYNGSFVYNAEGVTYTDYGTTSTSEECPELSTTSTSSGGFRMNPLTGSFNYLMHMQNENAMDDCSGVEATESMFNGMFIMGQTADGASLYNGEATMLMIAPNGEGSLWMDILTEDEVMDNELCDSEPISGTNTMTNGVDTYVYTFDGATDCDGSCSDGVSVDKETCEAVGSCSDGVSTDRESCEAAGVCSDGVSVDKETCEDAGEYWMSDEYWTGEYWTGEPTQMLSINGGEEVEVEGASCSVMSARTGLMAMFFAFGMSFLRRRRD